MSVVTQLGQLNTAALSVADVYVQIVPPQLLINGIPTNIVGLVGSASWGPVGGAPSIIGSYAQGAGVYGDMVARKYDLMSHVWAIYQQGGQAVVRGVRVTDGSDVAAAVTAQTNCCTFTSKWTGSKGNTQTVDIQPGSATGTFKARVNMPGQVSEVFDNIPQGIGTVTVVAGTGYVNVPSVNVTPAPAGGRNAQVSATLKLLAAPTVAAGGAGYVVSDTITLAGGIVLTVATVSTGAVATVTLTNPGSLTSGPIPTSPSPQIATSGGGTGATFTLGAFGLGPATITDPGAGYTSAPTLTLIVTGAGSGGSLTAVLSYWPGVANAINNGISGLRGPSQFVVATAGVGTTAPTTSTYTLAGGTDGASAIGGTQLLGTDTIPRKGMYALRGVGCSIVDLADCDDSTTWSTQASFGNAEGCYMICTGPSADTITNAVAVKASAGIDFYNVKLMLGDWVYINDTVNGIQRYISPQGFVAGVLGNLAPNQSSLNKPMTGIVGTQKSITNVVYTAADLQTLANAGIDVICNPIPYGSVFGCRSGRNTSSNAAIRGDNYTRMTNFIAFTVAAGMGKYIGTLQSADQRRRAKATLDGFFNNLQQQGLIGTTTGADAWKVTLDESNNPFSRVSLGYEQADVQVTYLSVVEFLIINIEGGQTVQIQRTTSPLLALAS